ncbi:hypothetical protein ACIGXM_01085 [Kitasatospora sp. NPDC052896]|uniref:hypothetical protein n=1 Tax=Kitasatospora sp. NPDC052896 TaxID=3364061 RepID=UPI0037CB60CE
MRVVRIASTVTATALLLGALSACGSSAKSPAPAAASSAGAAAPAAGSAAGSPKVALLAAAAQMQKLGSAKVTLGAPYNGNGVYSWQGQGDLDVTMTEAGQPVQVRVVDGQPYLGADAQQAALTGGKHWLKLSTAAGGQGAQLQAMTALLDPALQLGAATQSGELSAVGAETVNGVPTQHYRSTVPAQTLVDGLTALDAAHRQAVLALLQPGSTVTTDFWLDAKGELVQQKESSSGGSAQAAPVALTVGYTDFGTAVSVATPASNDLISPADAAKLVGALGG